ncbi:MAG: hypothetical protein AAFO29_11705 [Actinomycetota bacterium]
MTGTAGEMPAAEADLLGRAARTMVTAGPTLSGTQRRKLAVQARTAAAATSADTSTGTRAGDDRGQPDPPPRPSSNEPLDELTHRLTVAPASIRQAFVRELEGHGVPAATYVEVLGLVARLTAIDTFAIGLGVPPVDLPPPADDQPTGEVATEATIDGGWVPTVGPASPPSALSLTPSEHRAMLDLHRVFYLSIPEMGDLDADRGLHRTQMELVAARASLLNECFF